MIVTIPSQLQIYITHNASAIRNTIEYFQKHLDEIRCEIERNVPPPVESEWLNPITNQFEKDVSIDCIDTTFVDEMFDVFYKTIHVKIDSFAETGLRRIKEWVDAQGKTQSRKNNSVIENYYNYINNTCHLKLPKIDEKWKDFYNFHHGCNENKHEDEKMIEDYNEYSKYLLDNISEVEDMLLEIEKSIKEKLSINCKENTNKL